VFFAFTGWEMLSFTTGEYRNPRRDFGPASRGWAGAAGLTVLPAVMKPADSDLDPAVAHAVDETMLLGDPTGPPSGPLVPQWLRLPDPRVLVLGDVLDEQVDSLEDLAVL
jgi:hypothetical protein